MLVGICVDNRAATGSMKAPVSRISIFDDLFKQNPQSHKGLAKPGAILEIEQVEIGVFPLTEIHSE